MRIYAAQQCLYGFRIRTQITPVLAQNFKVQSPLEIYTGEVRFTRKSNYFLRRYIDSNLGICCMQELKIIGRNTLGHGLGCRRASLPLWQKETLRRRIQSPEGSITKLTTLRINCELKANCKPVSLHWVVRRKYPMSRHDHVLHRYCFKHSYPGNHP